MLKVKKALSAVKDGTLKKAMNEFVWIIKIAKKYSKSIIGYVALSLFGVVIGAVLCLVIGNAVNYLIEGNMSVVGKVAFLGVSLGVINVTLIMINQRIGACILCRVKRDLTMDVFDTLLKSEWEKIADFHSGDIMTRLSDDIKAVSENISNWIPSLIVHISQIIVAVSVIISFDASMLILIVCVAPIILFGSDIFLKKLYESNQKQRKFTGVIMSFNKDVFHNIQAIKAFGLNSLFLNNEKNLKMKIII